MFASQSQKDVEMETAGEEYTTVEKERAVIRLGSVRELRDEVMEVSHNGTTPLKFVGNVELTEVFANHTFVGIVDGWRRLAAIQHGVKLYLVDYGAVWYYLPNLDIDKSYEFFYQVGLSEFGNFGTIEIPDGLDLRELLAMSIDTDDSDGMAQQSQKDEIEVTFPNKRR